jgi:hypothetical protein
VKYIEKTENIQNFLYILLLMHLDEISSKNCKMPVAWQLKAQIMKLTTPYANKWAKIAHGVDLPLHPVTLRTGRHVTSPLNSQCSAS